MENNVTKPKFPTEIVDLPSKGLLYPKENPLSSGKIEMTYMSAREEDILTNDSRGAWWEDPNMEILAEHRMTEGSATIYNTMHWHRVFNFTDKDRMVISMAINTPIEEIFDIYNSGEFFK